MRIGLYVQVPFCQTKCTYCNFHTGVYSSSLYAPYTAAVRREISDFPRLTDGAGINRVPDAVVDTVYFGGGTPSLLEPAALTQILDAFRSNFDCQFDEVTLEADPETITAAKAAEWLRAGFNRISMGVQSFADRELIAAGRMHRRHDISSASGFLRDAGFENISFDLIAGLPYQTPESWEASLSELLSLRPEHVSIYLMEIDENSRLGLEVLNGGSRYSASVLPDDDSMVTFYERGCARLADSGYQHYEISNWSLPGFESRHNRKYWRRDPYYGFGAGAHSFNGTQRWANRHDPASYATAIEHGEFPVEQLQTVSRDEALEEELFLGLRQLDGIDLARIESQYNASLASRIEPLRAAGLVERNGDVLRLAPDRLAVSNEVFVTLLN